MSARQFDFVSLGDLGELRNGVNFKKEQMGYGCPVVNVKDVFSAEPNLDFTVLDRVELSSKEINKGRVKKDDLLFVRSSVKREGVGQVALARQVGEDTVFCGFVIRFRLTSDAADPRFLTYSLRSPQLRQHVVAIASGAAITNISQESLKTVRVPIPPLPIQQRIAAILAAYDDLIETNTRRISILEEMARRLYEEWFVHFRFPGHDDAEFVETALGRIPNNWQVQTISDTFTIIGGGTPSKKNDEYWAYGTIEWYSPTDLTRAGTTFMDGSSSKITTLGLQKSSARLFPPFSVMMTSRATIGVIAVNTTEACTNQGFITCLPNQRFPLYLLLHWLRENVEMFISLATGATFKEISKGVFKDVKIPVPPRYLANKFERMVAPVMQKALVLQRKNANLRDQRDLLLPKLVSGAIDVSDAEAALEAAE